MGVEKGIVKVDALNIRTAPSTAAQIVGGTLKKEQEIIITEVEVKYSLSKKRHALLFFNGACLFFV
jgi:hypothetical protein